ncbi:hypothetical protein ACJJTC_018039 [Scirpophaga incertulas]
MGSERWPNNKQARQRRKRTVDADDETKELPDPKRLRINLDVGVKEKVLKLIVNSAFRLYTKLNILSKFSNITLGHQAMSILQASHNLLRKMANSRFATHPSLSLTATITEEGSSHNITFSEATTIVREEATKLGLAYTASNRQHQDHWYGIANPLFNILSAFKMRYDEIRLGVVKIPVAKNGDTTNYVDTG